LIQFLLQFYEESVSPVYYKNSERCLKFNYSSKI